MSVTAITPTTGKDTVNKAIESVANQTIHTEHLIVIDGQQVEKKNIHLKMNCQYLDLPQNVGGDGWYGHRVYAAVPLLVNTDYVLFLDEDNWYAPNHVESMIDKIESENLMWAYSLRKIHNEEGRYITDDDCESLGKYPTFYDSDVNFVDTNCYCFRREYLVRVAHAFYGQWGADRQFYNAASQYLPLFECTGEATVSYRAPDRLLTMFEQGNVASLKKYGNELPWRKK